MVKFGGGSFGRFDSPDDLWRDAAQADLNTLSSCPFPLYAPTAPLLPSPALTEWQITNGVLVKVVLCHGEPMTAEGPWLQVANADAGAGTIEYGLADIVEDERDRLFSHAGIDESPGATGDVLAGLAVESQMRLPVDGVPVEALLRREGPIWAARLRAPDGRVVLTVTGRGVDPDRVALRVVHDLEPYAVGRQALLNALLVRRRRLDEGRRAGQPGATPAARSAAESEQGPADPPLNLAAHRQLVDYCVAHALRVEAAVREHRVPRLPRRDAGRHGDLWEEAVRQQMRLAGEDHDEANESVTALVNHMVSLSEAADWFPDSPEGKAALEESIRFTAFESEVRSAPAQRAWLRDWHRLDLPGIAATPGSARSPEEARLLHELRVQSRASWLDLWRTWHDAPPRQ
ncbi:hypothetical protein [Streptacidiphilus sp. MAP5-3]|uniref:hypothetical protein n=1 Tax=unclassified Streptacidiphilus TaxID=2643834 RepID=UPI003511D891